MKKLIKILTVSLVFGGALTLAACQKPVETVEKFEVAFETDGGTMYYTVRAEKGDSINLPTPEKEGYDFEQKSLSSYGIPDRCRCFLY